MERARNESLPSVSDFVKIVVLVEALFVTVVWRSRNKSLLSTSSSMVN